MGENFVSLQYVYRLYRSIRGNTAKISVSVVNIAAILFRVDLRTLGSIIFLGDL